MERNTCNNCTPPEQVVLMNALKEVAKKISVAKKKFGIGIPTYNRYDLLKPSLSRYYQDFSEQQIFVVDNGNQDIDYEDPRKIPVGFPENWIGTMLLQNNNNIGVGASWNQLCNEIFRYNEYALILNDDIYLGKSAMIIDQQIERGRGFVRSTPDWCAFLISKQVYDRVGAFDECFIPAYYEDKSYEYRMKLKGIPTLKSPDLNPLVYRSSQTIEKEPTILDQSKKNKKLYIEMWGGEPGKEKYSAPFNGKPNNS